MHGTLAYTRIARKPRYATRHLTRHSPGGADPDVGCSQTHLHVLLMCAAGHANSNCGLPLPLQLKRIPYSVGLSGGTLGLEHDDYRRLIPPLRTTVLTLFL